MRTCIAGLMSQSNSIALSRPNKWGDDNIAVVVAGRALHTFSDSVMSGVNCY